MLEKKRSRPLQFSMDNNNQINDNNVESAEHESNGISSRVLLFFYFIQSSYINVLFV